MIIKSKPAPHPFDHTDADVILRSSDLEPVDFRVFKLLLSLASPFFAEIFTLPQPSGPSVFTDETEGVRGVPVVQMTEDTETLTFLLGFCFPVTVHQLPRLNSLQVVQKIVEAAVKLEMEGLQKHLQNELIATRFIESQPVRVFAIAHRYGWDDEARKAARYTLRHGMHGPFIPELGYISGATYFRLQEYHRICGEVASSRALLQPMLADHDDGWTWVTCKRCPGSWAKGSDYPDTRKWWMTWLEELAVELRTRPWGETARKWDLLRRAIGEAESCPHCKKSARDDLDAFTLMLAVEIEKDIALIDIDLNFDEWGCSSPT